MGGPPSSGGSSTNPPLVYADQGNQSSTSAAPRNFDLTDCRRQDASFAWPAALAPGKTIPGWEGEGLGPEVDVHMVFMDCLRFGWGSFERPVKILYESHTKRVAPDQCNAYGSFDVSQVLHAFWVDDQALADSLAHAFGIPAAFANITVADQSIGGVFSKHWSVHPGTSPESSIDFWIPNGGDESTRFALRLAWWNGTVLGLLDWDEEAQYPYPGAGFAVAHVEPPMLQANGRAGDWPATTQWFTSASYAAKITLWKDTGCAEQL